MTLGSTINFIFSSYYRPMNNTAVSDGDSGPSPEEALGSAFQSLQSYRSDMKTFGICMRVSGSLSFIGSTLIVIHIIRSHKRLSTIFHRLMLGLSIGDILSSFFSFVLGSSMVPREMSYWVVGARGNVTSCTIQGFVSEIGIYLSTYYNCSVCFYYFAIIKYSMKEDYIRIKLEPWFHVVPIAISLLRSLSLLATEGYNTFGPFCTTLPNKTLVPHCHGLPIEAMGFPPSEIPCERGMASDEIWVLVIEVIVVFTPPAVIVVTMLIMCKTVWDIEKRARRYGVSTLRKNARQPVRRVADMNDNENHDDSEANEENVSRIKRCFSACFIRGEGKSHQHAPATSMKRTSGAYQKRTMLCMAGAFGLAWALVWLPNLLLNFLGEAYFFQMGLLFSVMWPLQGVFNFLVFMLPKIRRAKRPRRCPELSWHEAAFKAYLSRGEIRNLEPYGSDSRPRTTRSTKSLRLFLRKILSREATASFQSRRISSTENQGNTAIAQDDHPRLMNGDVIPHSSSFARQTLPENA